MQNPKTVTVNGNTYRIGILDGFQQWDVFCKIAFLIPEFFRAMPGLAKLMQMNAKDKAAQKAFDDATARLDKAGTEEASESVNQDESEVMDVLSASMGPLLRALGKLDRATSQEVFLVCLSVCERQEQAGIHETWSRVLAGDGKTIMYHDLKNSAPEMVGLAFYVIRENMGGFFSIAQQQSQNAVQK